MPRVEREICLFCDRKATSGEHLFSDWMKEDFPHSGNPKFTTLSVDYAKDEKDTFQIRGKTRRPHKRAVNTVRHFVVCDVCNQGWMSRLEKATKPILQPLYLDKKIDLSPGQLKILARWFALKTLINECAYQSPGTIPLEDHKLIFEDSELPGHWEIWAGKTAKNDGLGSSYHFANIALDKTPYTPNLVIHASATVFIIGHLIALIVVSRDLHYNLNEAALRDCLIRVSPSPAEFHWPPKQDLSDRAVLYLTQALAIAFESAPIPWAAIYGKA